MKLIRRKAKLHNMKVETTMPQKKLERIERQKAELLEEIELYEYDLQLLKEKRKETSRYTKIKDLPEPDKFESLTKEKKLIMDTVKMIAYRAETAMAALIKKHMTRKDEARALLRQVFKTDVDIEPDYKNKMLIISLHNLTNKASDKIIQKLCNEINSSETIYPATDLRLIVKLVSM